MIDDKTVMMYVLAAFVSALLIILVIARENAGLR